MPLETSFLAIPSSTFPQFQASVRFDPVRPLGDPMRRFLARFGLILLIVYLVLFGLPLAPDPLVKLIHQVGITLLLGAWLVFLWRSKRSVPSTPLDAPLVALGAAWTIAALAAANQRISLEALWLIFIQILLFYLFTDFVDRGRQRWVMEALFFAGAMVVILGGVGLIVGYFNNPAFDLPNSSPILNPLLPASIPILSLSNPNQVAAVSIPLIAMSWAWANTSRQKDLRWTLRFLTISLAVITLLTQSRGGMLGLAAIVGLELVFWLSHGETRNRLPRILHPFLRPKVLIAVTFSACIVGVAAVFGLIYVSPSNSDIARLDLWYSGIEIFRHHPILGAGPSQYALARLSYALWERSINLGVTHAHNLVIHVLASGGVVVFTVATWLVVRFARTWKQVYLDSDAMRRRRLEGVLIALIAFGILNMVDTYLETQFMVLIACLASYTIAPRHLAVTTSPVPSRKQALVPILLGTLIAGQVAYIPIHQGALDHRRAVTLVNADDPLKALAASRDARSADPSFDLYRFQEATILGILANHQPDPYLPAAIAAHEQALSILPLWDLGWHNLAALYAQAGRYGEAIGAEQRAIDVNPNAMSYWFKLGEYRDATGNHLNARLAFFEALRLRPGLASTLYWTDPEHRERQQVLSDAIQYFDGDPATAFEIAVYASDFEAARRIYRAAPLDTKIQEGAEALWINPSGQPCIRCYSARARSDLLLAETMLYEGVDEIEGMTLQEAARTALFLSDGRDPRVWYVLARMAEQEQVSDVEIEALLTKSFALWQESPMPIIKSIFHLNAAVDILPQARVPSIGDMDFEPLEKLAGYYKATGQWQQAQAAYESVLQSDPYAWIARQHLAQLSQPSDPEVND